MAAPTLVFGPVPDPTPGKLRMHIDLNATDRDQDAELERLLGLGATRADVGSDRRGGLARAGRPGGQRVLPVGAPPRSICRPPDDTASNRPW